jgi:predicted CxxxxCH...CXXCH cytochrome family protein
LSLGLATAAPAQERDLQPPHDPSNGIDCTSCHVPFGSAPLPTPPDWISNNVCKSCHIDGGSAPAMDVHQAGGGVTVAWCTDCHNPHMHQPDYPHDYIKTAIRTPNSGFRALAWRNGSDFLHGATGVTQPYDGICETCHTQTAYHRNNASGDHGHNADVSCTTCHRHQSGFQGACDSCHDAPPATGAHLTHFSLGTSSASYGRTAVDHLSTVSGYAFACGVCHPYDESLHNNGTVDVRLYEATATPGTMKALSPPSAGYVPGGTVYVDGRGISYTLGTCSNVYCHSAKTKASPGPVSQPLRLPNGRPALDPQGNLTYDPYPFSTGRAYQAIGWGAASPGCAGCHQAIPRTQDPQVVAATVDSHSHIDPSAREVLHPSNMGWEPMSCRTCHYNTVRVAPTVPRGAGGWSEYPALPIADKSLHVNGTNDVAFDAVDPVVYGSTFSLAQTTWNADTGTCSTVPCHLHQNNPRWGLPYRRTVILECDQCHRISHGWGLQAERSHPEVGEQSCVECHVDRHGG